MSEEPMSPRCPAAERRIRLSCPSAQESGAFSATSGIIVPSRRIMYSRTLGRSLLLVLPFAALAQRAPQRPAFVPNQYVLLLEDPPVAQRFGSREQLRGVAAVNY